MSRADLRGFYPEHLEVTPIALEYIFRHTAIPAVFCLAELSPQYSMTFHMERRVTQADVAREAKVHRSTVSMAFSQHPNIPEDTRNRILSVAEKLGYAPDPMLSALAAYRSQNRPTSFKGALAWIVNSAFDFDWRTRSHYVDYHKGAALRAKFHGFKLDIFDVNSPGMSSERIGKILHARRISGLLLCPQPRPNTNFDFCWEEFSSVTFGYSLTTPKLHTVAPTQFRASLEAMRQLHLRGYRRIGWRLVKSMIAEPITIT
jgi:DNA-binding LacI/PurR family transcriptional regulator